MRKSMFPLIILFFVHIYSYANSQNVADKKITIQVTNLELKKVFSLVEKQVSVRFAYSAEKIQSSRKVTLSIIEKPLSGFLEKISREMGIIYEVSGGVIILKQSENLSPVLSASDANLFVSGLKDARILYGTITDEKGVALSGVSVQVKGTNFGTTTDINGKFSIKVPDNNSILVFNYTGFAVQEILVGPQSIMSIKLLPNLDKLDDVVVIGYGTQKKVTVTGSIGAISSAS